MVSKGIGGAGMNKQVVVAKGEQVEETPAGEPLVCGIVMPISAMGAYEKSHWDRVRIILDEAIKEAGYRPRLVSESEDIGVIHARIVQNLYDDEIIICDVSGKNANVMFELGLRLAFDKPTIIIKDDLTDYSFDTSPIQHIGYRHDLRFDDVRSFQKQVSEAIKASVARRKKDADYSPFLGHFGKFKVAGLDTKVVDSSEFIIKQLESLRRDINRLSGRVDLDRDLSSSINASRPGLTIENVAASLLVAGDYNLNIPSEIDRYTSDVIKKIKGLNMKYDIDDLPTLLKQLVNKKTKFDALIS